MTAPIASCSFLRTGYASPTDPTIGSLAPRLGGDGAPSGTTSDNMMMRGGAAPPRVVSVGYSTMEFSEDEAPAGVKGQRRAKMNFALWGLIGGVWSSLGIGTQYALPLTERRIVLPAGVNVDGIAIVASEPGDLLPSCGGQVLVVAQMGDAAVDPLPMQRAIP